MDTDKLISHSRARFQHVAAKRVLKEKYQGKLIFAYSGGMWQAGPELIVLLSSIDLVNLVLSDLYEHPCMINRSELLTLTQQRWQEQMTAWLVEYDHLSNQR